MSDVMMSDEHGALMAEEARKAEAPPETREERQARYAEQRALARLGIPTDRAIFDSAKFYDCNEQTETLSHESAEDALEYFALEEPPGPVEVFAFNPKPDRDAYLAGMASRLREHALDSWSSEEYGDPEGGDVEKLDAVALESKIAQALREYFPAEPWGCDLVARREYSAVEVAELIGGEHATPPLATAESVATDLAASFRANGQFTLGQRRKAGA